MIQNYDDLYKMVSTTVENYSKEDTSVEIFFTKNENKTCELKNKQNGNKLVFMFARYGDEYKVGFALYTANEYGGVANNPEWIEDILNTDIDEKFVYTLISEHLMKKVDAGW